MYAAYVLTCNFGFWGFNHVMLKLVPCSHIRCSHHHWDKCEGGQSQKQITKQTNKIGHILSFLDCPYSHTVCNTRQALCISWTKLFKNGGCSKNQYLFLNTFLNIANQSSILKWNADTALVHMFRCWNHQWRHQVSLKHYTYVRLHSVTHPWRQQPS